MLAFPNVASSCHHCSECIRTSLAVRPFSKDPIPVFPLHLNGDLLATTLILTIIAGACSSLDVVVSSRMLKHDAARDSSLSSPDYCSRASFVSDPCWLYYSYHSAFTTIVLRLLLRGVISVQRARIPAASAPWDDRLHMASIMSCQAGIHVRIVTVAITSSHSNSLM